MPASNVSDTLSDMGKRSITELLTESLRRSELEIDFARMNVISSGAQGSIYLTKAYLPQEDDENLVAKIDSYDVVLKELHKESDKENSKPAFSVHLELTHLLGSTAHRNIIKIIGVVIHEGKKYAVLPYCETFLDREIDKFHQLLITDPVAHAIMVTSFLKDMLNALTYMHAQHFVHNDVKPANIAFCAKHGAFALSDIDSAESTQRNVERAETFPLIVQGTIEFMHPRIIVHPEEVALSYNDTYGLGKTLLFLIDPQAVEASKAERIRCNHPISYYFFRGTQYKETTISENLLPTEFAVPTSSEIKDIQVHLHEIADRMMGLNINNLPNLEKLKEHCNELLEHIKTIDRVHTSHSIPLQRRLYNFVKNMILTPEKKSKKDTHSVQAKEHCPSAPSSVASNLSRRPSPPPEAAALGHAAKPGSLAYAPNGQVCPHVPTRHPLRLLLVRERFFKRASSMPPTPKAKVQDVSLEGGMINSASS